LTLLALNRVARTLALAVKLAMGLALALILAPASTWAATPVPMETDLWHVARIHGHRIYYAMHGSGPTLLLLHGGGDSGVHSFEQQIVMFSQRHHLIAPDQVGQGRTPDVHGPLSYTGMLQDTVALLTQLKLRNVDVMGFSDGGILALMLAIQHPELVRRLVISGVNIAPEGLTDETREGLRAELSPRPKTVDQKLAQLWLNAPTPEELNLALLATIHKPVLVISGDRDAITLEHTLTIYHALPQSELCILPGTDHGTFSSRPQWLNPIITEFLDRADIPAASVPEPAPAPGR
jgi:pimeloyl-ACP methyl ester carboxylesterase